MVILTEGSGTDSEFGSGTQIIEGLLPYGSSHGDLTIPKNDDGYSEDISLETDVVIFGFSYNRLYVSHNVCVCVCVCVYMCSYTS